MIGAITAKTLNEERRALALWGLGVFALVLLYESFYPSVRNNAAQFQKYFQNLPDALRRVVGGGAGFASPVGYLKSELFSTTAPLLLLILSIGSGARATAGEEERRTLDLLLVNPVTRRRVVLEKVVAMVTAAIGLGLVMWASLALFGPAFELRVGIVDLAAAAVSVVLLGVAYGALALFIGCWTGRRGAAIAAASGLAVSLYLVNILAPSIRGLRWLQMLSPFHYYADADPLERGFPVIDDVVLAMLGMLFVVAAVAAFDRRDPAA